MQNYKGLSNVRANNNAQKSAIVRKATQLKQQVLLAGSPVDLQARMSRNQGPIIPDEALFKPLQTLKADVVSLIDASSNRFVGQLFTPFSQQYLPILKKSFRDALLSFAGGLGLAAVAWNPGTQSNLLSKRFRLSMLNRIQIFFAPLLIFLIPKKSPKAPGISESDKKQLAQVNRMRRQSERAEQLRDREERILVERERMAVIRAEKERLKQERIARKNEDDRTGSSGLK